MTETSPLGPHILFHVGPLPIAQEVATTWAIMALLALVAWIGTLRLRDQPGRWQMVLESVVAAVSNQIRDIVHADATRLFPLIATLFLFIAVANLSGLVPGVAAPTASIETPVALGVIVFFAIHFYGIRKQGLGAYLRGYLKPTPLMLPLNVLSEFTRIFSLMIRLFGNIMSHEFVIGVILSLAGLLVPIPFMALAILIGLIQAYIFTVLATVFIGAGLGAIER